MLIKCVLTLCSLCVALQKGDSQSLLNSTPSCMPVEAGHICNTLPARNSLSQYPQLLPVETDDPISSDTVMIGFLILNNVDPLPDPDCLSAIRHIFCIASSPPCNNDTGLLLPICPDSCLAYLRTVEEGLCNSLFEYARDLLMVPDFQFGTIRVFLDIVFLASCFDPGSYYFYEDLDRLVDPNQCTDLYTDNDKERILSRPNQCVSTPPSICADTALLDHTHHLPLESRNTTHLLTLLNNLIEEADTNCTDVITLLGCYYIYPPCDPTSGDILPLCPEVCEDLSVRIKFCLWGFLSENELVRAMGEFNCSNTEYTFPAFVHVDESGQCLDNIPSALPPSGTEAGVIVGVVLATAALVLIATAGIILGALTLCYCRRKTKRKFEIKSLNICDSTPDLGENLHPQVPHRLTDGFTLSRNDIQSYEEIFSSILVPYALLTLVKEIGQGAFGKVHLGRMRDTVSGSEYNIAVKTIKNLSSRREVKAFFKESLIMMNFKHPNILGLNGVCFDTPDGVPYILLPYMVNGSVKDYLKAKRKESITSNNGLPLGLTVSSLLRMCMDVANGMEYLAAEKFVHRDLAARNCMLDVDLGVKVGDFGLARDIYSSHYYRADREAKIPVKWMAPETLEDAISNEETDVWSYGVTCWEVFSLGRAPYPGIENRDIFKHITNGHRLERPSLCPTELYSVAMTNCWEQAPEDRPSFSQLVLQLQEYWEDEHAYVVE